MKLRVSEIEKSRWGVQNNCRSEKNSIKISQSHIQDPEKRQEKNKIEQELSSKEYNLLFHDIPQTEIKEEQETYGTPTVRYFVQIL